MGVAVISHIQKKPYLKKNRKKKEKAKEPGSRGVNDSGREKRCLLPFRQADILLQFNGL